MDNFIDRFKEGGNLNLVGVVLFWCVVASVAWLIFGYHIFGHHNTSTSTNKPLKMSTVNVNDVTNTINAFRQNSGDRSLTTFSLLSKMAQAKLNEIYTCGTSNNCGPGLDFNNIFNKDVGNPNGVLSILVAPKITASGAVDYWLIHNINTLLDPNDMLIGVSSSTIASQPELVVMLYNPN